MEYGQLSGLNYKMTFPGQAQEQDQAVAPQAAEYGEFLPQQKDPLAVREGLTDSYYNNYATLQAVVKDALAKGLNPFEPDYSEDNGGGLAFKTFQRAQANLLHSANALRGEYQAEQQMRPLLARGDTRVKQGVDTNGMYMSDPNNFYSTALDPIVTEANKELGDARYTQRDSAALNQAIRDPRVQQFQQLIQSDPQNAEYYQRQIDGLLQNTPQTSYQQLIDRTGTKKTPSFEIDILRDTTNLAQGVWPDGTYNVATKDGKVFLENKKRAGEFMGSYQFQGYDKKGNPLAPKAINKIIKRWLKDPKTGEVFIEYENPEVPMERVSSLRGDAVASNLIANNPKYGSVNKMYEAARQLGITDDTGSVVNEALIPQNAQEIKDAVKRRGSGTAEMLEGKVTNLKRQLDSLGDPKMFGNNWVDYTTPDGKAIQVAKHRGKKQYYIKNWEDLGFSSEPANMTADEVFKTLGELKYFDKFLTEEPTQRQTVNPGGKKIW